MENPPLSLSFGMYVVEFAIVNDDVTYCDRKTINVDGEWLGKVSALAICKHLDSGDYFLSHCDKEWNEYCCVESEETIGKVKHQAELHYKGIGRHWRTAGYNETEARNLRSQMIKAERCSFCGVSSWEREPERESKQMVEGDNAKICSECIARFYIELRRDDS